MGGGFGGAALAALTWMAAAGLPADFPARFAVGPAPYPMPAAGSYALPPLRPAPDGEVLDEAGRAHQLSTLLGGKVSLVSFVYLLCGDTNGCPLAMATLHDVWNASAEVPGLKDRVQLVTISFDPARDTPEALAAVAFPLRHDPAAGDKLDWLMLTTADAAHLAPLLAGFGQTVDRSQNSDRLNHLLRLFLVDGQGRIRNIYGLGMMDPQLMMTDVATLLAEEDGA